MGNRIIVCHWTEGGHWNALDIPHEGLNGHDGHNGDIWPPIPEVTDGSNWPQGEAVYYNNCAIEAVVTPSPSPSPSLPETGLNSPYLAISTLLILIGLMLVLRSRRVRDG